MSEDKRPEWKNNTPEEVARWFAYNHVVRIDHCWQFTGEDTAESWLVCHAADGETKRVDTRFFQDNREIMFRPDHAGLVRVSRSYPDIYADVDEIDAWEKSNAKDREEYARLKNKFNV